MNLPDIFDSDDTLRHAYIAGLERQISEESLGSFILVLANALFDKEIFARLKPLLEERFNSHQQLCAKNLCIGKPIAGATDDVLVFLKLIAMGFNQLSVTEYSCKDGWELQYNQLRSLRPKRISTAEITNISQDFNEQAFHFNKPFLAKEIFWSGEIEGKQVRLLYNKFPFANLHGLLVPEPENKLPQLLTSEMHVFISQICNKIAINIPEIAIAYNGYGAGASINHLHFQTFTRLDPLPVCDGKWKHNGGNKDYPATCETFDSDKDAWRYIENLHHYNTPYNLLYLPDRIFCLSRRFQGSFDLPSWTESFAWYELCGGITTFNKENFQQLNGQMITSALLKLRL